jgi:hypothetical protein
MPARRFEPLWDCRAHQVARREASDALLAGQVAPWEPRAVYVRAPITAPPLRTDQEHPPSGSLDACQVANTERIQVVLLLDAKAISIPPGTPQYGSNKTKG